MAFRRPLHPENKARFVQHGSSLTVISKVSAWNKKGFFVQRERLLCTTRKASLYNKEGFFVQRGRLLLRPSRNKRSGPALTYADGPVVVNTGYLSFLKLFDSTCGHPSTGQPLISIGFSPWSFRVFPTSLYGFTFAEHREMSYLCTRFRNPLQGYEDKT